MKKLDIKSGEIYGNLKVISEIPRHISEYTGVSHRQWLVRCINCDMERCVLTGSLQQSLNKPKCQNCRLKPSGKAGLRILFKMYRIRATKKRIDFALSKRQFHKLTSQSCHYCGVKPFVYQLSNRSGTIWGNYPYNGIDRIDNAKGYSEGLIALAVARFVIVQNLTCCKMTSLLTLRD